MPREIKGTLYYLQAHLRYSFIIFWSIMIGVLVFSLIMKVLLASEETVVSFDFSIPIYLFGAIFGYYIVKNTMPYLIKMGVTRKSLFVSVGIHILTIALLNAIIANTIYSLLRFFYGGNIQSSILVEIEAEETTLAFTHFADIFMENTWLTRVVIDTSITFFLLAATLLVGLIFYRFGLIGGIGSIAAVMLIFILGMTKGWLVDFFLKIYENFSFAFFYQLFAVGILLYLLSFILIRRITV